MGGSEFIADNLAPAELVVSEDTANAKSLITMSGALLFVSGAKLYFTVGDKSNVEKITSV